VPPPAPGSTQGDRADDDRHRLANGALDQDNVVTEPQIAPRQRHGTCRSPSVLDVADNLSLILDHVGDGVTVQDATGRLVYVNGAAARSLGFASAAELLATPLPEVLSRFAVFAEDGSPFPLENLPGRRALAGEPAPSVTVRFRVHDTGEERWSTIRATPVVDATGQVIYAVNVWQDATAQKRAEAAQRFLADAGEALSLSLDVEATLASIARLAVPRLADWCVVHLVRDDGAVSQLAVAHADPERVAWALELQERYPADPAADQGVYRVVRTGRSELIPEVTDAMLVAAARDAEHLQMLRRLDFTSALVVPMIAREQSVGAITFVAAESRHHYDGRDLALAEELARRAALAVASARLYDAERAARSGAEEAQVRFRALFEGVPDAIMVVDAEGRYIDANAAACAMLGYALDELLTMRIGDLAPDPDAARAIFAKLEEVAEWRDESQVRRRDGTVVPVEVWSRRLDLAAGPIGIAVLRDISERLATEQVREEVLAAISHDLRSPLGSIKLHAQALQRLVRRGGAVDPARLDDSLSAIDAMSTRVAFLLEDIVDVARARGGEGIAFSPQPTDLVELVQRCAAESGAATGRAIVIETQATPLVGQWDPRAIERVVLNLLNNALKYSPHGGDVVARVTESDDGAWASLTVDDEGIGIPAADLPRIFERYRRGRNVGQIGGTGLGLTGARQIVERHGGTIDLASDEGRGTRVTVRLPLRPPDTAGET
jgi:PAS domain S-box-containing protein